MKNKSIKIIQNLDEKILVAMHFEVTCDNLLIILVSYLVIKMINLRSKETFVLTKELLKLL